MQRSLIYCAAILILAATPSAFGATVFLDTFTKANGALLGTTPNTAGGNWTITGTSVVNPLQIASNAVPMTTTGQDAYAALQTQVPNVAGNVLHTGVDINVSQAEATPGDYFLHVSDPAGTTTNFYQRLFARIASGGGGFQLGLVDTSGTGSTTTYGSTVLSFGTSHHVDINWTFVAGPNNDTFAVNVDSLSYLNHTWTSATAEPNLVSAVNLRQGTIGPGLTLDNLTLDAPTVVPEPATIVLLGCLSFAGFAVRGRALRRR